MSDSIRRPTSKLSFITIMLTKLRSVPAPAPIAAADEIDRLVELVGRLLAVALREERRGEIGQAELALRIERAAGADDHPHADDRLLVVEHGDDLQAVRQRLELVRRELHVRARPAAAAGFRTASAPCCGGGRTHERARTATHAETSHGSSAVIAPSSPDGIA